MKGILLKISIVSWALCFIIIVFSFFNINLPSLMPFLWCLCPLVFIVFIPSVLYAKKSRQANEDDYNDSFNLNSNSVSLLPFVEKAPISLLLILVTSFLITAISAIFMFTMESGTPEIINNQFVLQFRGQIVRKITEKEFYNLKLLDVRYSFGFILIFYAVCILVISRLIEWESQEEE